MDYVLMIVDVKWQMFAFWFVFQIVGILSLAVIIFGFIAWRNRWLA